MPNVVMRAPLRLAWPHGQQRPGAVQCLDLGLLVHTQDQRSIRRVEVQAHNITDLFDKERVRRQLEGIRPMGLQSEGPPYAVDGAMAQARASGHRARAPVGRIRWSSLKGHAYDSLHVSIGGPAGCTRSRLVQQSIHSPLQEPRPPLPHRRLRHPDSSSLRPQQCLSFHQRIRVSSAPAGPTPAPFSVGAPTLPVSPVLHWRVSTAESVGQGGACASPSNESSEGYTLLQ